MRYDSSGRAPLVRRPDAQSDFLALGLPPDAQVERLLGAYEYADDDLAHITLRHRSVSDTDQWLDVTSYRPSTFQPVDFLLREAALARLFARTGDAATRPVETVPDDVVLESGPLQVTFERHVGFELASFAVKQEGMAAVVVIERSARRPYASLPLVRVTDFSRYADPTSG
jgi:hypothetical protein